MALRSVLKSQPRGNNGDNLKAIDHRSLEWMPKDVWGPIKWRELHARALSNLPMAGEEEWFVAYVEGLPCARCRRHFDSSRNIRQSSIHGRPFSNGPWKRTITSIAPTGSESLKCGKLNESMSLIPNSCFPSVRDFCAFPSGSHSFS